MSNGKQEREKQDAVIPKGEEFREKVVGAYRKGAGADILPSDDAAARSLIPPGTAALRDFSYIAPEFPALDAEKCVGCMECVTKCPDSAILAKVTAKAELEKRLAAVEDAAERERLRGHFAETTKYYGALEKKGDEGGLFGLFVDPTKCKGCAECVEVCGTHEALSMVRKTPEAVEAYKRDFAFFKTLPDTPAKYINEKVLADVMLAERSLLYVGGAGSCMGCGEATAIRMMLAATGFVYGPENVAIVAATGCNTVYGSSYPFNPYLVPWTNSLFENAASDAMGVRLRWDQMGWQQKRLWAMGGDGAILDIGFGALSRLLASGMDIKVLVLDTQVYSNTGGQASTATYTGQDAEMSPFGTAIQGKQERRKELGIIAMMHANVFVAQTTTTDINHFYRSIMAANEFKGPAVISVYCTCQPEHQVADDQSSHQARLAKDSRTFPIFVYDPREGSSIRERLSLQGNPSMKQDWYINPKTEEPLDFIAFARTEGRFAKHFDRDGTPSEVLLAAQQDRLEYWHLLQELAGLR
jgi:pyruvate/2-oxoacid:ferredoxin oxidoreductase beta subunit/Fe-S-cluster-containing hydrogenase component 2